MCSVSSGYLAIKAMSVCICYMSRFYEHLSQVFVDAGAAILFVMAVKVDV